MTRLGYFRRELGRLNSKVAFLNHQDFDYPSLSEKLARAKAERARYLAALAAEERRLLDPTAKFQ